MSFFLVTFNSLVVAYSAIFSIAPVARYLGSFSISSHDFPGTTELLIHLTVCLIVEDAMFYLVHRTLHYGPLYRHIHSWHHVYKTVIALSSENAHPIEYSLGNLLPVTLGPLLMRSHAFTFFWVSQTNHWWFALYSSYGPCTPFLTCAPCTHFSVYRT